MREFYLYAERPINNTIEEVFSDFKINIISNQFIKKNNIINQNILFVLNENLPIDLNDLFFLKNNVVIFFLKKNNQYKKKYFNTKIFIGHTNINKFKDDVVTFFESKPFIYKDIKIVGEKLINLETEKEISLTPSEKNILSLLFERKKIERKYLLENVLKLRNDTETKTIESHLTRIRKKLLTINSQIDIISRENIIFLVV